MYFQAWPPDMIDKAMAWGHYLLALIDVASAVSFLVHFCRYRAVSGVLMGEYVPPPTIATVQRDGLAMTAELLCVRCV